MKSVSKKVILLGIDWQNSFCDKKKGTLFVPGSDESAIRTSKFIQRSGPNLWDIFLTLDTHHQYDIGHPLYWKDHKGRTPVVDIPNGKFPILVTSEMIENGEYTPRDPKEYNWALKYAKSLESQGKYNIIIWPYHCLINSPGTCIYQPILDAVHEWERQQVAQTNYITKGSDYRTEHYGAHQAEVPINDSPSTQLNTRFINALQSADDILICGEARSHCLASTVQGIADNFGDENIKKLVLLEDACDDVPTFEANGEKFVKDMVARGMRVSTTTDYSF